MKKYALAVSHLPHQCCGADEPLVKIQEAVKSVKERSGILLCSCGGLNWDLQLTSALEEGVPVELVLLEGDTLDGLTEDFGEKLSALVVSMVLLKSCKERDSYIFNHADAIFSIWVRPHGHLAGLITALVNIDYTFDVSHYRFRSHFKYQIAAPSGRVETLPSHYLWHWTRTSQGKWPGESQGDYCKDLLNSSVYPRSALDTLRRILEMGIITASGACIHRNEPVVSFTENHPVKMLEHFKWRSGRHRMNFEPYGVGFPRSSFEEVELVKVKYNDAPSWKTVAKGERWSSEKEWRHRGDCIITEEMKKNMVVIVHRAHESPGDHLNVYSYSELE